MATTTPNYGWSVPTSTDLVTNGATAIETLGDAIDASMNTALGTKKAGMVLLNTTSFSAVSSVSLPTNTFTSTYDFYKVNFLINASSTTINLTARLRASGSDLSTSSYYDTVTRTVNATVSGFTNSGTTAWDYGSVGSGVKISEFTLYPYSSGVKYMQETSYFYDGTNYRQYNAGHLNNSGQVCDSMSIILSTGTISGVYSVYGFNK
jgi:hypothetical protein